MVELDSPTTTIKIRTLTQKDRTYISIDDLIIYLFSSHKTVKRDEIIQMLKEVRNEACDISEARTGRLN